MKPHIQFIDNRKKAHGIPFKVLHQALTEANDFLTIEYPKRNGSLSHQWVKLNDHKTPFRPGISNSRDILVMLEINEVFGDDSDQLHGIDGHCYCWPGLHFNENLHDHIAELVVYLVDSAEMEPYDTTSENEQVGHGMQLPLYGKFEEVSVDAENPETAATEEHQCPSFETWGLYFSPSAGEKRDDKIWLCPQRIWEAVKGDELSFIHYFTAVLTHEFAHALMAQPGQTTNEASDQTEEPLANLITLGRYNAIKGENHPATRMIKTFMARQPKPYCDCFEMWEKGNFNWLDWKLNKTYLSTNFKLNTMSYPLNQSDYQKLITNLFPKYNRRKVNWTEWFQQYTYYEKDWQDFFLDLFLPNFNCNSQIQLLAWESCPGGTPFPHPNYAFDKTRRTSSFQPSRDKYLKNALDLAQTHPISASPTIEDVLVAISKSNFLIIDILPTHGFRINSRERTGLLNKAVPDYTKHKIAYILTHLRKVCPSSPTIQLHFSSELNNAGAPAIWQAHI